ncbi:MAG: GvpL/GvpF family gas vesicle protein [Desulfobacterales bacterium]|nr:GvpL/GvpF family gas vesicle protein [Desulfobacterales bacterium]
MSYLLYCIFHNSEVQRQATLPGVGGQPVFAVAINGISAAVSEISDAHLTPDVPRVMAYQKVIESFHSDRTVIPMRYGCVLRDRPQVIQLLKRNAGRYESLLKELDGCMEMGIRLMIDDCRLSIEGLKKREMKFETRNSKLKISGKAYLDARKAHYAREDRFECRVKAVVDQCRAAFSGLFIKYKAEYPSIIPDESGFPLRFNNQQSTINNQQLIGLYFLVPGKSIDAFRRVFRHMRRRMETTKLLLSGPWPPYNFVLPDNEQRRSGPPDEEAKER